VRVSEWWDGAADARERNGSRKSRKCERHRFRELPCLPGGMWLISLACSRLSTLGLRGPFSCYGVHCAYGGYLCRTHPTFSDDVSDDSSLRPSPPSIAFVFLIFVYLACWSTPQAKQVVGQSTADSSRQPTRRMRSVGAHDTSPSKGQRQEKGNSSHSTRPRTNSDPNSIKSRYKSIAMEVHSSLSTLALLTDTCQLGSTRTHKHKQTCPLSPTTR
jgi:hypothetical protein